MATDTNTEAGSQAETKGTQKSERKPARPARREKRAETPPKQEKKQDKAAGAIPSSQDRARADGILKSIEQKKSALEAIDQGLGTASSIQRGKINNDISQLVSEAREVVPGLGAALDAINQKGREAVASVVGNGRAFEAKPLDYSAEKEALVRLKGKGGSVNALAAAAISETIQQNEGLYEFGKGRKESDKPVNVMSGGSDESSTETLQNMRNQMTANERRMLELAQQLRKGDQETDEEFEIRRRQPDAIAAFNEQNRLILQQQAIVQQFGEMMGSGMSDGGVEGMRSYLPKELVNLTRPETPEQQEEARNHFRSLIEQLEEQFYDQSFETNWRLITPLETYLQSLSVDTAELKAFKKSLTAELRARASRHNYSYVYAQVSGITDLIGPANFLRREHLQTLFGIENSRESPEEAGKESVPTTLRKFEELGKKYQEKNRIVAQRKHEKRHGGSEAAQIAATKERDDVLKEMRTLTERNWSGRVASGLFCALGEAARYDVPLNGAGSFFWNRIPNFQDRASDRLRDIFPVVKGKFSIDQQDELVAILSPVANLRIDKHVFWIKALEKVKDTFKADLTDQQLKDGVDRQKFSQFLAENRILGVKEKGGKFDYSEMDLSKANFKNLQVGPETSEGTAGHISRQNFNLEDDFLKITMLDFDDCENVRKLFWNPRTFLQNPTFANLIKMSEPMKHLFGGSQVYAFFETGMKALGEFYGNQRFAGLGNWIPLPEFMRTSLAKITMGQEPWDLKEYVARINILMKQHHLLDKATAEKLIDQAVGPAILGKRPWVNWWEYLAVIVQSLNEGRKTLQKETKS